MKIYDLRIVPYVLIQNNQVMFSKQNYLKQKALVYNCFIINKQKEIN